MNDREALGYVGMTGGAILMVLALTFIATAISTRRYSDIAIIPPLAIGGILMFISGWLLLTLKETKTEE